MAIDYSALTGEELRFFQTHYRRPAVRHVTVTSGTTDIFPDDYVVVVDASSASATWTLLLPYVGEAKGRDLTIFVEAYGSYTGNITDNSDDSAFTDDVLGAAGACVRYYCDGIHWYRASSLVTLAL